MFHHGKQANAARKKSTMNTYAKPHTFGKPQAATSPSIAADHPNRADVLFEQYCTAARQAQNSLDLNAGIEAGKAWARFIGAFAETA